MQVGQLERIRAQLRRANSSECEGNKGPGIRNRTALPNPDGHNSPSGSSHALKPRNPADSDNRLHLHNETTLNGNLQAQEALAFQPHFGHQQHSDDMHPNFYVDNALKNDNVAPEPQNPLRRTLTVNLSGRGDQSHGLRHCGSDAGWIHN